MSISYENFFLNTKAYYSICDIPERTPDFTSDSGSRYWYGSDENGDYVVRVADHWCDFMIRGNYNVKRMTRKIRSCVWHLYMKDISFTELQDFAGKCYLQDFQTIEWTSHWKYKNLSKTREWQ